jgi:hypothetical protein
MHFNSLLACLQLLVMSSTHCMWAVTGSSMGMFYGQARLACTHARGLLSSQSARLTIALPYNCLQLDRMLPNGVPPLTFSTCLSLPAVHPPAAVEAVFNFLQDASTGTGLSRHCLDSA